MTAPRNTPYLAGMATAGVTALLIVWTTIVRDDGSGAGHFMVILAAGVGAFVASFRAGGVARAMLGVAVMQALLGLLTATAPIVADVPGESAKALLYHGAFALLWLVSAGCFLMANRPASAHA